MLEAGFIASRFLHYVAVTIAFGAALFPFYSWRPGEPVPQAAARAVAIALPTATLLAILSGAVWFGSIVNDMADSSTGFLDSSTVSYVLSDTDFGRLWLGRAIVAFILLVVSLGRRRLFASRSPRSWILLIMSGVMIASLAGTGHTQSSAGATRYIQEVSDGAHLLAAGAWLGGLVPLAVVSLHDAREEAETALARFSGMGYIAVALLLATGMTDGVILVGTLPALVLSAYGRLLVSKILIFGAMVMFAGVNRFILVPSLVSERGNALAYLRRHILLEQLLGIAVLLIVSVLGMMSPPAAM
jgi:putative copper resistance protein D